MLTKEIILKTLSSYDLNSSKYGPTIYENNSDLGICFDIKDPLFGYLTRIFIFNNKNELEDFLNKYFWYKNNYKTYNIILKLTNYETKITSPLYYYKEQELTFNDMVNLKDTIKNNKENLEENYLKKVYLLNIEYLTNHLITLKNNNYNLRKEKNTLKIKENDLKFELLANLTTYYGKERTLEKKAVSLDNLISNNNDISLLQTNLQNIKNKSLTEIKSYLEALINLTKEEELNEKNLINIYSNNIYKYNINILNKQIEFVKNKINAEKNFNLKGSKIHNIDEELKSFLKNSPTPTKINDYLEDNKNKINNKYKEITDLNNAYTLISGNPLSIPQFSIEEDIDDDLDLKYNNIPTKNSLILYTSFYKDIINYILDNNYPSLEDIKKNFDFTYYYNELEEIIHNENNSHYLLNYFKNINFKTLDTYIESIINIAKDLETSFITINNPIKAFTILKKHKYQELTLTPLYSKELTYIIDIPSNTNIIYIPEKLIINEETNEISLIKIKNIYYNGLINNTNETITVNKYIPKNNQNNITYDLTLTDTQIFYKGELK